MCTPPRVCVRIVRSASLPLLLCGPCWFTFECHQRVVDPCDAYTGNRRGWLYRHPALTQPCSELDIILELLTRPSEPCEPVQCRSLRSVRKFTHELSTSSPEIGHLMTRLAERRSDENMTPIRQVRESPRVDRSSVAHPPTSMMITHS